MNGRPLRKAPAPSADWLRGAAFELSPWPSLVVDRTGALAVANEAAEALFGQGLALLSRGRLLDALPADSGLALLLRRAIGAGAPVREHALEVSLFGQHAFVADTAVVPLGDGALLLTLNPQSAVARVEAADAPGLAGLGRMMAHEIKNPLQGIRGAAQLLRSGLMPEEAQLAQLIVDETDRIRRLVDHMEFMADPAATSAQRRPVNIHAVLDRVRAVAVNGVAAPLAFREAYDPSLPSTPADEDQLIQIFLNLVKNAAEAALLRDDGLGEIAVSTAFRHGMRVRSPGGELLAAPLEVRVQDNGPGVPQRLREHLFEPFVTTKPNGQGLGLPLVARLVAAHGGLVDFESEPGRTVFRVLLTVSPEG